MDGDVPTVDKLLVFLASPGDVQDERRAVHEAIAEVNRTVAAAKGIVLQVVSWEHDTFPGYGTDAQAIVNNQIAEMERYALFIGIMWGRLGSPTPRAPSGTVEEFERAADALERRGQPVIWFYFRETKDEGPDSPGAASAEVRAFRRRVEARGLPRPYATPSEFRDLVRQHLTLWLNQRAPSDRASADQQIASLVTMLEVRAEAIRADWDEVLAELVRLHQADVVERLSSLEKRFLMLHARHLTALGRGDLPLSHELVGEIHDVLFRAREIVSGAVGTIGREWFGSLRHQYLHSPTPEEDVEYAGVQRDMARLHAATNGRMSSMQYPAMRLQDSHPTWWIWYSLQDCRADPLLTALHPGGVRDASPSVLACRDRDDVVPKRCWGTNHGPVSR